MFTGVIQCLLGNPEKSQLDLFGQLRFFSFDLYFYFKMV
jgi:hypothetical protein